MADPAAIDKYLYIKTTPTWKVRSLYLFGILSWSLVLFAFSGVVGLDPFFTWFVTPMVVLLSLYQFASFGLNLFFYRQHDLKKHRALVSEFWKKYAEPPVDIFLPICGEDADILLNTWTHVSQIKYRNKHVYVLDDSKQGCDEHKRMAQRFGFTYIERPNKGEMKKAGNMKYAFERTTGKFIVVLDGDFAPHPDFLRETLPYMNDPKVGIVQTPQYFETTAQAHKHSPLAYGAARAQEVFYRVIQVARDRLGGAHCCGTCAVYRRDALNSIGGFVQMGHSEDAHTGFGITSRGWTVRYLPVILSIGICPDNPYAFFHQQHRWCLGNTVMTLDKKFWHAKIPWRIKFCYLTGFLYNIHYPLVLLFSFQLFWTLFMYSEYISIGGAVLFYPHIIFSILCVALFPLSRLRFGYFYAHILKAYSNTHALLSIVFDMTVEWLPTGAKHTRVSLAFLQTTRMVGLYVLVFALLTLLAVRTGDLRLLDYNFWSVQFWIFWNLVLSGTLLWQLCATIIRMNKQTSWA